MIQTVAHFKKKLTSLRLLLVQEFIMHKAFCECCDVSPSLCCCQSSKLVLDAGLVRDVEKRGLCQDYLQDFFVVLALCNTVVLSRKTQDSQDGQLSSSVFSMCVHKKVVPYINYSFPCLLFFTSLFYERALFNS